MGLMTFFNPHGGSTTDSFSHSPPTIVELSAQMAPLLQMQTLTSNPIQNQDPLLTTPTPSPDYDDDHPDHDSEDNPDPHSDDDPNPEICL
ncbi:hypothetical protein L3X38_014681 [Prunus dulcis]|uniref:Uncharacterized protein n=1 Tax=Prunus dulcis TaxID=3755 RepID=A0AAD4WRA6_PRUDU|nr:hypothetical protein L3X38_014681 [Prunus dulcis]